VRRIAKGIMEVGTIDEEVWEVITLALRLKEKEGIFSKPHVLQPTPITLTEIILG
jgi:hypothetical protein